MKKKVAIQGIAGSYHDIAARNYFEGEEIEIIGCNTFRDVIASVVESAHQFAGLEGNLHFVLDMRFLFVYQKFQPVVFFGQVGEQKAFRVVIGLLHIVNVEFFKIADDNPAGTLGIRQIGGVSLRLLKWRQQRPVGLPDGLL